MLRRASGRARAHSSAVAALLVLGALPHTARADGTSAWDCFRRDGRFVNRVEIWWGHRPGDAAWACNQWTADCGGDCVASGNAANPNSCDVRQRMDGCSISFNDPSSNAYKEVFRDACNAHDACYHAPWDTISDFWAGFNKCNDNFWNDMNAKCGNVEWYNQFPCRVVASVWADAMNFDPGRTNFSDSFSRDQQWMSNNCSH